ncbi:MAG: DNA polymerase III [Treponema sp.]|nr:DNA polymerase III [Treponema sp.]
MFNNIVEQAAVLQLKNDINAGNLAPSMLFYGPGNSGKGSAALELSRILSCEKDASWKCACASCGQHRYLQHEDLLLLGKKQFAAEINAGYNAYTRSSGAKPLFIRSLRKLLMRFSPVLMEDDPKLSKISSSLQSLDEMLNEFIFKPEEISDNGAIDKICKNLVKEALAVDEEGTGDLIPVGHIRKAAYWCRLAPNGKRKTLVIENAQNMRDESRNSLLKLLEEPPKDVSIVLTAQRREALIPTILSRLRPYRFLKRSAEGEREVLRRVFQVTETESAKEKSGDLIGGYLDSFLPQSTEKLNMLAAWFIVSLARITAFSIKNKNMVIPGFLIALGERCAPAAENSGFERTVKSAVLVKTVLKNGNFNDDSFSRFLKQTLDLVCAAAREEKNPQFNMIIDIFRKYVNEAATSVEVLNQSAELAFEALVFNLKTELIKGCRYG